MDACSARRSEELKETVDYVLRHLKLESPALPLLDALSRELDASRGTPEELGRQLQELGAAYEDVQSALTLHEEKSSVDRAEGFLADLAEDRSTAPAEIVPLIDQYISSVRDAIGRAWERHVSRRELDACVLQVRLSYSRDLDRILQGLL